MIKLNAGFSRKVGEANFGSRGASVNLELELESGQDAEKMHEKIRALFGLARKAVDEELRNGGSKEQPPAEAPRSTAKPADRKPDGPVCAECGAGNLTPKVVKYSEERFGKVLCYGCQKKLNGEERKG